MRVSLGVFLTMMLLLGFVHVAFGPNALLLVAVVLFFLRPGA